MLLALTGAPGFIGQHLLAELPKRGYRLCALLRRPPSPTMQCASAVIGDLSRPRNMSAALEGVHAVIHSAGFTHGMTGVPEEDYRTLNTEATSTSSVRHKEPASSASSFFRRYARNADQRPRRC